MDHQGDNMQTYAIHEQQHSVARVEQQADYDGYAASLPRKHSDQNEYADDHNIEKNNQANRASDPQGGVEDPRDSQAQSHSKAGSGNCEYGIHDG